MTIPALPWHSRFNNHYYEIQIGPEEFAPGFISIHKNQYGGINTDEDMHEITAFVLEAVNNYQRLKDENERFRKALAKLEPLRKKVHDDA